MSAQTARIEEGRVLLPESAPWLEEFRSEVMAFPNGRHDDQVDSLAQALAWFIKSKRRMLAFG
jgi:predicted phage terminase large subunit-like protein